MPCVTQAFNAGDFHSALRRLYRLEGDANRPELDRYKANGWYNLALRALREGDCAEAHTNLDEARALLPGEPTIESLAGVARSCATSRHLATFTEQVDRFPLRALTD